jgi:hypothetical protein
MSPFFGEMPGEVRATLNSYVPLDADDETVKLLRETFRDLPSDGRVDLAEDIIQAGAGNKLHQLAQSIVSGLLKSMMVAGTKKVQIPRMGNSANLPRLTPNEWTGSRHRTDQVRHR